MYGAIAAVRHGDEARLSHHHHNSHVKWQIMKNRELSLEDLMVQSLIDDKKKTLRPRFMRHKGCNH